MKNFQRPRVTDPARRKAAKTGVTVARTVGMLAGISGTIAGWIMAARGKPTPLVNSVHFSNIGNALGLFIEHQIKIPPSKVDQLTGWVDESLERINGGELIEFVEIEGDAPLFTLQRDRKGDGNEKTLTIDMRFHIEPNANISGEDLTILKHQLIEATLVLAHLDNETPEFKINVRFHGETELLEPHMAYERLLIKIAETLDTDSTRFKAVTQKSPTTHAQGIRQTR